MKKILFLIAFLSLNLGVQAQTENPKENPEVIQKFAYQVDMLGSTGEWWQLERLCKEKADSIYDPILAFGRGMAASKFLQYEDAIKDLEMSLYEYADCLPDPWLNAAGDELIHCLNRLEDYEHAAKVAGGLLEYFSNDSLAESFQGAIKFYKNMLDMDTELAKYPKMTLSHDDSDITIPFHIDSIGERKSPLMIIDGPVQGKSVHMLFDTGCGNSIISRQIADELHLRTLDTEIKMNGAGHVKSYFVIADSMLVGNMALSNIKLFVSDDLPPGVDMIIGLPIMQLMSQFTMDFEHRIITSPSQQNNNSGKRSESSEDAHPNKNITIQSDGLINVRIYHNYKPIDMTIDSGNGRENNLDYTFYTENKEEVDKYEAERIDIYGAGGSFNADFAKMKDFKFILNGKQYSFPSINVIKEKFEVALAENNMGFRFMSSFKRVTINLKDAYIEFE